VAEGTLYLLPVWLGEVQDRAWLPAVVPGVAARLRHFHVEHERSARRALRAMVPDIDLDGILLHRLDKDSSDEEVRSQLKHLLAGEDAGILSEAGMPCIADPGAKLVAAAHRAGIVVEPLPGPASPMLALAGSGMNGQRFTFHGYLPREKRALRETIMRIEREAARTGGAQLFIETPYRNDALLSELLAACAPSTLLCIAADLTQPDRFLKTLSVAQWRKAAITIGKRPAVFIIGT
jgi:16S rRNA (cytidine1402-2'-O)-methyltransferase